MSLKYEPDWEPLPFSGKDFPRRTEAVLLGVPGARLNSVCVCVCVRETYREREREKKKERAHERARETKREREKCSGSEAGPYLRLMDVCITQL